MSAPRLKYKSRLGETLIPLAELNRPPVDWLQSENKFPNFKSKPLQHLIYLFLLKTTSRVENDLRGKATTPNEIFGSTDLQNLFDLNIVNR